MQLQMKPPGVFLHFAFFEQLFWVEFRHSSMSVIEKEFILVFILQNIFFVSFRKEKKESTSIWRRILGLIRSIVKKKKKKKKKKRPHFQWAITLWHQYSIDYLMLKVLQRHWCSLWNLDIAPNSLEYLAQDRDKWHEVIKCEMKVC